MSRIPQDRHYRRGCPHGLMFHRFHKARGVTHWQGALSQDDLEAVLLYVGIENILSPQEWMSRLRDNRLGENDLCITFDDGLRCQADYALPVLEKHGLQAFWFVYSCIFEGVPVKSEIYSFVAGQRGGMELLIERFLGLCPDEMSHQLRSDEFATYADQMHRAAPFYTSNDIKFRFLRNNPANKQSFERVMDQVVEDEGFRLDDIARHLWLTGMDLNNIAQKGHYIGLHSHDHNYQMATLSYQEQLGQYARNYAHIQRAVGKEIECVSYPLNSYNEDSMDILRNMGIYCGFRANMLASLAGSVNPSSLELAREDSANIISMLKNLI